MAQRKLEQTQLSTEGKTMAAEKIRKRRPGAGKKPLREGERTVRATVNLPESDFERAERKAGTKGISAYLRRLVEKDLKRAG